jgi:hypothetical protein
MASAISSVATTARWLAILGRISFTRMAGVDMPAAQAAAT